jgi:glutamate-1-semialdehyde 2,1-aminomutase
MAAGCAVLDQLLDGSAYARLERLGELLAGGLADAAARAGVPCTVNRCGSMLTPFIGVDVVDDHAAAARADTAAFARVHRAWRQAAVLWPPSQFEAGFLSTAHVESDIDRAVSGFADGLRGLPAPAHALSSTGGPAA